jgi:hypothetical protein
MAKSPEKQTKQPEDKKQDVAQAGFFVTAVMSLIYMGSSSGLTLTNKKIYAIFGDVSPLNLLMVQCLCNVFFCVFMMTIKELSENAFHSWIKFGIVIPKLSKIHEKTEIGLQAAAANLTTVFFGLYSVKYISVPLFLAFRRCAILASIIVMFFVSGTYPSRSTKFGTLIVTSGALIAGWDKLESDALGFVLVWLNNFS